MSTAEAAPSTGDNIITPLTVVYCTVQVADANVAVSTTTKSQKPENGLAFLAIRNADMKGFEYRAVYDLNKKTIDLSVADLRSQATGSLVQNSFPYPKSDFSLEYKTIHSIVVKKKNPAKKNRKEAVQRTAAFSCEIAE